MIELTQADLQNPLWQRLRNHYIDKLKALREKNDAKIPDDDRNILIGRIQEVREIAMAEQAARERNA